MLCRSFTQVALLTTVVAVAFPCLAADTATAAAPVDAKTYQQAVDRGIEFLRGKQTADGAFAAPYGPGVTAVAATGLMRGASAPTIPWSPRA